MQFEVESLRESLHPYVVFLPLEQKSKILGAIFGSKAAVSILEFSLEQGISRKIYQRDLVRELSYSNKTIIGNLKSLTKFGILTEGMEKSEKNKRIVWVKAYQLTDLGRWFALLLAQEKDLSESEKAEIFQSIFRSYLKWARNLSEKLHVKKETLHEVFLEEMQ